MSEKKLDVQNLAKFERDIIFPKFIDEISNCLDREIKNYIFEKTDVESDENLTCKRKHIKNGNIGFQCVMGGDWENPTEFVLFINCHGDVWTRIFHDGNNQGGFKTRPHKKHFKRVVKMMSVSPDLVNSDYIGSLSEDFDSKNLNLTNTNDVK